jgi:hypothetical protein
VLLLRADAERSAEKRIAFCALAAQTAEGDDLRQAARRRKALLSFDVLRGHGSAFLASDVLVVASELEDAGELERAADAYALAGDADAEVRVLTAAGAIERLEERLRETERSTRTERELELGLRSIADLDRTAERRAALDLAAKILRERDEPRVADAARAIRSRLARGPVIDLEVDGALGRYALGGEVTVGRGDATIVVSSRASSRRHLRLARGAAGATVEDLGTRNGTTLAGARITAPIAVGSGVRLQIGGEVPCAVEPAEGGFALEIAGERYLAPLGELAVAGWRIGWEAVTPEESFVVLRSPEGAPRPFLGDYQLAARIELCHGDEIRAARGGPVRLRVPAPRASLADEDTGVEAPFPG